MSSTLQSRLTNLTANLAANIAATSNANLKATLTAALCTLTAIAATSIITSAPAQAIEPVPQAVYKRVLEADKVLHEGHVVQARRIIEPYCYQPYTNCKMYIILARTYFDDLEMTAHNGRQAEKALDAALKADPKNSELWYTMAMYSNSLGQFKKATEQATRGIELKPVSPGNYKAKAIAESGMGDFRNALTSIDLYIKNAAYVTEAQFNMKADILYNLKRYDEAVEVCRHALKMRNQDTTHYKIARMLQAAGRLDEAVQEISTMITRNPKDAEALSFRAKLYRSKKDEKKALADLSQAIELEPSSKLYKERVAVYQALGKNDLAAKDMATIKKLQDSPF